MLSQANYKFYKNSTTIQIALLYDQTCVGLQDCTPKPKQEFNFEHYIMFYTTLGSLVTRFKKAGSV